jgi:predicted dienelactone hydrolase
MPRCVLAALLVLLLTAALAGCTSRAGAASTSATTAPSSTSAATDEPPLPDGVTSRVLQLTDPSRTTDPTPQDTGNADATPGRSLPTTLYYPATGAGPFPVVVFSHGLGAVPTGYRYLLTSWAAAGFVVAAPRFPLTSSGSALVAEDVLNQPADVSFVLTQVLALDTTADDDLAGRIDTGSVAVAGHSAGAITTLGLLSTCCADPRIEAAVVMAGERIGFPAVPADPSIPVLLLHGSDDGTIPVTNGRAVADGYPGPAAFVELTGGTHTEPYANPGDDRFAVVRSVSTDFLEWALLGDAGALARLRDAVTGGVATLPLDRLPV